MNDDDDSKKRKKLNERTSKVLSGIFLDDTRLNENERHDLIFFVFELDE